MDEPTDNITISRPTYDLVIKALNTAADELGRCYFRGADREVVETQERLRLKILNQRRELKRLNTFVRAQSLREMSETIKRQNREIGALQDQLSMYATMK